MSIRPININREQSKTMEISTKEIPIELFHKILSLARSYTSAKQVNRTWYTELFQSFKRKKLSLVRDLTDFLIKHLDDPDKKNDLSKLQEKIMKRLTLNKNLAEVKSSIQKYIKKLIQILKSLDNLDSVSLTLVLNNEKNKEELIQTLKLLDKLNSVNLILELQNTRLETPISEIVDLAEIYKEVDKINSTLNNERERSQSLAFLAETLFNKGYRERAIALAKTIPNKEIGDITF